MNAGERVYGYSGACALVQALATGYFLWDLIVSTLHIKTFGVGMWFHAVSALWVFSLGFVSIFLYNAVPDISGRELTFLFRDHS